MHYKERLEKYISLLHEHTVIYSESIKGIYYLPCDYWDGSEIPALETFLPFEEGGYWGGRKDSHAWFAFHVNRPENGIYRLKISTNISGWASENPQMLVYIDGKPKQGVDLNHLYVDIPSSCDVMLYAYTGPNVSKKLQLFVELQNICESTQKLAYDLEVPYQTLLYSDQEEKGYADTIAILNKAVDLIDFRQIHSSAYKISVEKASAFLQREFYQRLGGKDTVTVCMVGHTHIDIAWLWTMRQTREKALRSFSTVLALMEKFPEFEFFSSQPILYAMVKKDCPELYKKIQQRIKEGRWEPEGAMWVEPDTNLASGESLVRQILFGKRFFRDEFGVESHILWLPDVFGYSAALPQIMKKAGIDSFVTQKISWNDTNRMPYDAFYWEGIDGSNVLTYFVTTQNKSIGHSGTMCTYVGEANPSMVSGTVARFTQKEITDEFMMLYGWGDGGGGPTEEFLQNIRRMDYGIPNCPKTKVGKAGDFLQRFSEKVKDNSDFPRWSGELYLEYHRGTYTTAAKNKKNNRYSEFLLLWAEMLSVMGNVLTEMVYPQKLLDDCWEIVLHNQFHDILPGSSIQEVYAQTDIEYDRIKQDLTAVINERILKIAGCIDTDGGILVFNPHSFINSDYVRVNDRTVYVENIPAKGYKVCCPVQSESKTLSYRGRTLSNSFYDILFGEDYSIISIFDKRANREVLAGAAKLVAYEDYPFIYDAWELSDYYKEKPWPVQHVESVECLAADNGKIGLRICFLFGKSVIRQTVFLYEKSPRIEFEYDIDWHEEHILLQFMAPVQVRSDYATYDIQFGSVRRTTSNNTSWDRAKFETCAHKYVDISEYGYGVSLLTDSKYGYSVKENIMTVSLLKSPTWPNPVSDQGRHQFRCCLIPHAGDYRDAGIIKQAYGFNNPMRAVEICKHNGVLPSEFSVVSVDEENIILETIKSAEAGDGIIFRFYESFGMRGKANIKIGLHARKVYLCDLLEQTEKELILNENRFILDFQPYEILTCKLILC